jgi:cytochrome c
MQKRRATLVSGLVLGLAFCSATSMVVVASAQMSLPQAKPVNGAALFKQQCATCHTTDLSDPLRQGPPLVHIVGRQAGKFEGFSYSPALARADFSWDEARLDAWLTNPQDVIPGAIMPYRQPRPETRAAIIGYLKGLN